MFVNALRDMLMKAPMPHAARDFCVHPAGPLTSKCYSFLSYLFYSLLLGSDLQVDDLDRKHWRFFAPRGKCFHSPVTGLLLYWFPLDALLNANQPH